MKVTAVLVALLVAGIVVLGRGIWADWRAEADVRRARQCTESGQLAEAEAFCERALRRRPGHAEAGYLLEETRIRIAMRNVRPHLTWSRVEPYP